MLLVDHRTAGLWLPTGGHVEPDEDPATTVTREAREELGIDAVLARGLTSNPLFVTQTTTVGVGPGHIDVSLWYVLDGQVAQPLQPDSGEFVATAVVGVRGHRRRAPRGSRSSPASSPSSPHELS